MGRLDIDDLTSPRLTDIERRILQFTESRYVEFNLGKLLAEARDQAGAEDFGDATAL